MGESVVRTAAPARSSCRHHDDPIRRTVATWPNRSAPSTVRPAPRRVAGLPGVAARNGHGG